MPRTTNNEYLIRHGAVQRLWHEFPETFMVLSVINQLRVHWYYQTLSTDLDEHLLRTRDVVVDTMPSLPQAAGKAFAHLSRCFQAASNYGNGDPLRFMAALGQLAWRRPKQGKSDVVVHGVVRPDVDWEGVERILKMAREDEAA